MRHTLQGLQSHLNAKVSAWRAPTDKILCDGANSFSQDKNFNASPSLKPDTTEYIFKYLVHVQNSA